MGKSLYLASMLALLCIVGCRKSDPAPDFSGLQDIPYSIHANSGTSSDDIRVSIFPNPFFQAVNIMVHNPAANEVVIFLSDEKGKYSRKIELPDANKNYVRVDFIDMPKGVYLCEIQQQGRVDRYRLIKAQ